MKKNIILKIISASILFCLINPIFSYNNSRSNNNLKFDYITTSDGLPSNITNSIFQDSYGFIWISSNIGVVRYDGYKYKKISYLDSINFDGKMTVSSFVEDRERNIWFGTFGGGIFKYNREFEEFYNFKLEMNDSTLEYSNYINTIFIDKKSDNLWLGTNSGLNLFNTENNENHFFRYDSLDNSSISGNFISDITEDKHGNLWIGTKGRGINKFDRNSEQFTRYLDESSKEISKTGNYISKLQLDSNGTDLWVGAYNFGLRKLNTLTGKFTNYQKGIKKHPDSLSSNKINSLLLTADNNFIWLGTPGDGLIKFDIKNEKFETFKYDSDDKNSVISDFVYPMIEDNTGIIWFTTAMSGICKLDKYNHKFKHIKRELKNNSNISSNRILTICDDSFGYLWIATDGRGVNRYNKKTGEVKVYESGIEGSKKIHNDYILSIYEDKNKTLWFGTAGEGLFKYNRKKDNFDFFVDGKYQYQNRITDIFEDSDGDFWLCTRGDGLKKFDRKNGTYEIFHRDQNDSTTISSNAVRNIKEDSSNILWVATYNGLNSFDKKNKKFTNYQFNPTEKNNSVRTILIDDKDRIWCSSNDGLLQFDKINKKFIKYRNGNSIQLNKINGIIQGDNKTLWLGTNIGVSKYNIAENKFYNYSEKDGLLKGFINPGAFHKDSEGNIYFAGNNGISYFNPKEIIDNTTPPNVYITAMYFQEHKQGSLTKRRNAILEEMIELDYWQNDISFEVAALQYSRPENNQFSYKLDNLDRGNSWFSFLDKFKNNYKYMEDFKLVGDNQKIDFINLPSGNYILTIKAANSDGYWNEKGKDLIIIIHPPLWETSFFRIFVFLLISAIIYYWHKKRVKKLEIRKIELEERVLERTEAAENLNKALEQVKSLKERLQAENSYLQNEIKIEHNFSELISQSKKIKKVLQNVEKVAETDSTVMVLGESGTGKELITRAIHNLSTRRDKPLIKINCAALPANLIESELFGHEKGAFTGAFAKKIGKFELANKGTIFLDEIGDLPLELQSKLLRVLQEKEFEKLGGHNTQKVDVRIIVATNRDLKKEVDAGKFREDLFFRLNVFPITIPPLRDRKEDIPLLVNHFVKKFSAKIGKTIDKIPNAVIDNLTKYNWPGNIRELENIIERAVILTPKDKLVIDNQMISSASENKASKNDDNELLTLQENEKKHIIKALEKTNWKVSGKNGAAVLLNINAQTLVSRMKKLKINLREPLKRGRDN